MGIRGNLNFLSYGRELETHSHMCMVKICTCEDKGAPCARRTRAGGWGGGGGVLNLQHMGMARHQDVDAQPPLRDAQSFSVAPGDNLH